MVFPQLPQTEKATLLEVQWLNQVDSLGYLSACFAKENILSTVTGTVFRLPNYILSNSLPRLFLLDTVFFTSCLKLFCSVKRLLHFIPGHLDDPYAIISSPGSQFFSHYPRLS